MSEEPADPTEDPTDPIEESAVPADEAAGDDPPIDASGDDSLDAIIAEGAIAPSDAAAAAEEFNFDQASIDELLKQASFDDPSAIGAGAGADIAGPQTAPFPLQSFSEVMQDVQVSSIDLLRDVDLNVKIELGRSRMLVEDVLKLTEGAVVELDKLAGDPVDVFVNDRLVARGEVLVLNDNFCVRINEIVAAVKEEGT